jgi:hypothetical protein
METLLFRWGLECGGSEGYRITENGKDRFVQRYSYMDFNENNETI